MNLKKGLTFTFETMIQKNCSTAGDTHGAKKDGFQRTNFFLFVSGNPGDPKNFTAGIVPQKLNRLQKVHLLKLMKQKR